MLTIHGARGSSPVAGRAFARYGGHTTCLELAAPGEPTLLIDAGSGLRDVTPSRQPDARYVVLFTHFHWDHVQGLPFFAPLFRATARWTFIGHPPDAMGIDEALDRVIRPPWFPVSFLETPSHKTFVELGDAPIVAGPFTIAHTTLQHPGGVTAYRISARGTTVVVATDVETGNPQPDPRLRAFAAGADVLIHDAQYTPDEYATSRVGWGHSTWRDATDAAAAAGVHRLILTSHDPHRTDDAVDAIVTEARARFAATEAAYEGLTVAF